MERDREWPGIFVSSTCLDLIDLRAELEPFLRDLGFLPMLSDRPTSNFEVAGDRDAIGTCLENVKNASAFICVLSQRYGARLNDRGFGDISTTHLEYRTARAAGRPIFFYVRDRLLAEYHLWQSNKGATFTWVKAEEHGLFELVAEHDALEKSDKSNWISSFQSSVDLKARIAVDLGARSRRARLSKLLELGNAPAVMPRLQEIKERGEFLYVSVKWQNIGSTPALDVTVIADGGDGRTGEIKRLGHLGPGASTEEEHYAKHRHAVAANLAIRYTTPNAEIIEDRHEVTVARTIFETGVRVPQGIRFYQRRLIDGWGFYLGDEPQQPPAKSK